MWAHGQIYDPHDLGAFLYFPSALLVYIPFTLMNHSLAAAFWQVVFATVFTWGCLSLTTALFPNGAGDLKPNWLAGLVLLINIPAAWFNFKGVQSQIIMTGGMLIAAAAIIRAQWLYATLWLSVAILFKPLALTMALLCAATCRRMQIPLAVALFIILALPFAFFDATYVISQYRDFADKLWLISVSPVEDWPYRADISTLLQALGIVLAKFPSLAMRLAAAAGTLYLVWRVRQSGSLRGLGFALVILSACYINLFSPRNEFLSFLALTPSLAILAFLVLARDQGDWRGWALIVAALVLGMWWSLAFDAVVKPAIVLIIYIWLAWLMVQPERWRNLVEGQPQLVRPH